MARIVVIGNAAGAKSTLARKLANRQGLPLIELDQLLWQQCSKLAPAHDYSRQHAKIIARDEWVIDALGGQDSIVERLVRATEIVLIDMPLWTHFYLAASGRLNAISNHLPPVQPKCPRFASYSERCGKSIKLGYRPCEACATMQS